MKKSIWIAAAMCAAVFLALAGCTFGGDEENGGKVENRFAGKTIEHENTRYSDYNNDGSRYEYYEYDRITFTKNTATVYWEWRSTKSDTGEVRERNETYEYTYELESVNGKNVLHLTMKNPKYYVYDDNDKRKEGTFDEYVSAKYNGISSTTKELLRKVESTGYIYYEFADNNTVKMYNDYYVGDMTKSSDRFSYDGYDSASSDEYDSVSFGQDRLRLQHYGRNDRVEYWGIPQFDGKSFTAEMYRVEYQNESGNDKYIKIGTLEGNYAINGTGSKCTGTVSFTKFPDEMKNLFKNSYQVRNYDSDGDGKDEEPDYTEYTIK
ncbi:MAG: hypothetical protein K2I74_04660 [Treponemataceae bacterium]|nr:hypothetical protein [Treponemataceae bacterium]